MGKKKMADFEFKIIPPSDVVEASASGDPDDVSVASIKIMAGTYSPFLYFQF